MVQRLRYLGLGRRRSEESAASPSQKQSRASLGAAAGRHLPQALGIGYAPKGMMKGYVAIPTRLPTGELTGYIGITEAKLPKEFHLSNVVTFPRRLLRQFGPAQMRGRSFYLRNPDNRIL
jgi:hypothetical protein